MKQSCTLPFPSVEFRLEIPSVALPHCNDASIEAVGECLWLVEMSDEALMLLSVVLYRIEIPVDIGLTYQHIHAITAETFAHKSGDVLLHLVDGFGSEWNIGISRV